MATTMRMSCAEFEMLTIVRRSMHVTPARSTRFWTERPLPGAEFTRQPSVQTDTARALVGGSSLNSSAATNQSNQSIKQAIVAA